MNIMVYLPTRGHTDKLRLTFRAELRMVPPHPTTGDAATIQNLASIAGRHNWRPATERDRDELVAHLQSMTFEDDEVGDWLVMVSIGDDADHRHVLPPTRLRWVEEDVSRREATQRGHREGQTVRERLRLLGPLHVTVTSPSEPPGRAS